MTKPTDMWDGFLKSIRHHLSKDGVETFIRWPVIRKTMILSDRAHEPLIKFFQSNICDFSNFDFIFEFGAGHGRICKIIHRNGFSGSYAIFDFPELNEIQKHYLKDIKKITYHNNLQSFPSIPKGKSLFISMSALEESPKEIWPTVFSYARNFDCFLFKFSGGYGEFMDFSKSIPGKWEYKDTGRSVYFLVGEKEKK